VKRIVLFLLTNLAVIAVASVTLSVLGFNGFLTSKGINFQSLLVFCAVFGFAGSFISLLMSKWMAKRGTGTRIIERPSNHQEIWLVETVAQLAKDAGIGMPEVGIFPAQQANAFATGANRNKALVAISEGMLQRFTKEEIEAVLAHEIGHVANGDMITLSLMQGVVNTFVMFFARIIGYAVDQFMNPDREEGQVGMGYYVVTIIAEIVLGVLATTIVMAFSRYREYRADKAGATLGSKQGMIGALRRLQAETQAQIPNQMPDTLTAFGITSGFSGSLKKLWASHPPLEERIRRLENQ